MADILEISNLKAYYITQAYGVQRTVKAVDDISLNIRENEVYGIVGESGCGKSTLIKVLMGAVTPPLTVLSGTVRYVYHHDHVMDILSLSAEEIKQIRWREVSYIPQGSMHLLNPVRRIKHTFRDFVSAHKLMSKADIDVMVRDYLRNLGLPVQVLNAYPHQLSGGMRQRVAIALSTILLPRLIFADEPTTALDVVVQRGVIQLLKEIQQLECTLVIATHDMGVHANLADRIAVLYAGKVVEEADTQTIFKAPLHPYTQYLIQSLPKMDDKSGRVSIPGRPPALDHPPDGCRFHPRCPHAGDGCGDQEPSLVTVGKDHRVACFSSLERA